MRIPIIILSMCVCVLFSSCAYQFESGQAPERIMFRNDIKSTLIMPFVNISHGQGDISSTTEIFTSELARFREINVVHPAAVVQYLNDNQIVLDAANIRQQALRVATVFNVESVIIGTITEHNAFYPPILGLSLELIDVETGRSIETKSETYDSSYNYVRNELTEYTSVRRIQDSLYGKEIVLHKFDLYIRFVCYQVIKKYF